MKQVTAQHQESSRRTRRLALAAAIAALYTAMTLAVAPISSGLIQCRISEALCVLPWFFPSAVPGLTLGCLLSNLLTGAPLPDIIFGTCATYFAAKLTCSLHEWGSSKFLAPFPPVIFNAVIVGALLVQVYGVGIPYVLAALYVGIGESIACYGIGLPLLIFVEKRYEQLIVKFSD